MVRLHIPNAHRVCAATLIALVSASCGTGRVTMPGAIEMNGVPASSTLRVRVAGTIETVPLERYVAVAALSEVTPTGETPAVAARIYEVQSIIARTYAVSHLGRHGADGFDLCDQTHCQLYQPDRLRTSSFAGAVEAATARTRGQVLRLDGAVIDALFHADCGGHTTTPAAAWNGTNHSYLAARADEVPGLIHRQWIFEASMADWRTVLNSDPRTSVGTVLTGIDVAATGPGDRVTSIRIAGERPRVVSGDLLRTVVTAARGPQALMSTRFTIQRTAIGFRLSGSGFGHGVGLCQRGTMARARRGESIGAILGHYYPGARLSR